MSTNVLRNIKSYSTFSPFVIIKRHGFEEKKEVRINLQRMEVKGWMVVTLVKAEAHE